MLAAAHYLFIPCAPDSLCFESISRRPLCATYNLNFLTSSSSLQQRSQLHNRRFNPTYLITMHSSLFLTVAASGLALVQAQAATGKLGDAAIVEKNPAGVTYTAVLPNVNTTGIRGYVAGTSNSNGTGANFNINLYGFPDASLGPFRKSLETPAIHAPFPS